MSGNFLETVSRGTRLFLSGEQTRASKLYEEQGNSRGNSFDSEDGFIAK